MQSPIISEQTKNSNGKLPKTAPNSQWLKSQPGNVWVGKKCSPLGDPGANGQCFQPAVADKSERARIEEIEACLDVLFAADQVIEMRALDVATERSAQGCT